MSPPLPALGAVFVLIAARRVPMWLSLSGAADTCAPMALAARGTIAGNMSILGGASNVIIVQPAGRGFVHDGFRAFAGAGVPLANVLIYWAWIERPRQ